MLNWLTNTLRRITTSGLYLAEIDGLRFVAIFMVVAYHVAGYWTIRAGREYEHSGPLDEPLRSVLHLGFYGVHLFFVISGFVLAMPFCRHAYAGGKPVDLRAYFARRLTRLEPPYVISMLLFFATMPLFGKQTWGELTPHLVASLAYVHNIVYGCGSLINNNAWSLEIEVQFYILVPLLAAGLRLPPLPRRLGLTAAIVAFSLHRLWLPAGFPLTILQFAQYFLAGILLCDFWTCSWRTRPRSALGDFPGLAAVGCFALVNLACAGLVADVANPWLMAGFFRSALCGRWLSAGLTWGWVPVIGGMCYSIYLVHARVIALLVHGLLAKLPLFGSFVPDYLTILAICCPVVLVASTAFFLLVEKPCMNPAWPERLLASMHRRLGFSAPASSSQQSPTKAS